MYLIGEVIARIRTEILRMLREDEPVQHDRAEGKKWPRLYHVLVGSPVAICDPALSRSAYSRKVVVFSTAPDGIRIAQPERRWIRPRCEIYVQIRLVRSQLGDQGDRCIEVAVEAAARDHAIGVFGSIELELIHAIAVDEIKTHLAKILEILRPRERESTFVSFISRILSGFQALVFWLSVASPRRKPHSRGGAVFGRSCRYALQRIGEPWIEMP